MRKFNFKNIKQLISFEWYYNYNFIDNIHHSKGKRASNIDVKQARKYT